MAKRRKYMKYLINTRVTQKGLYECDIVKMWLSTALFLACLLYTSGCSLAGFYAAGIRKADWTISEKRSQVWGKDCLLYTSLFLLALRTDPWALSRKKNILVPAYPTVPVSYTHLDVYKRQVLQQRWVLMSSTKLWCWEANRPSILMTPGMSGLSSASTERSAT